MANSSDRSRRSFLAGLLTGAAGGWVALSGLVAGATSALSGCPPAAKYGGPTTPGPPPRDPGDQPNDMAPPPPPPRKKRRARPTPPPDPDTMPKPKYGGPMR